LRVVTFSSKKELVLQKKGNCPGPPTPCAGAGRVGGGATTPFASTGRKAFFFEKKKQKTFDHFGFGLSGWAQPSFAKVFWFFFSKKNASLLGGLGRVGHGVAGARDVLAGACGGIARAEHEAAAEQESGGNDGGKAAVHDVSPKCRTHVWPSRVT
jgi:hypothetical protein